MAGKFSAGASALGYLYQALYALDLLLEQEEEAAVSIEGLDDVVFEQDGKVSQLLQFKHHLSRQASLSDSSEDLWKTIRIWSDNLAAKNISVPQVLLTLVTTAVAANDSVAALLRADKNRDPEHACQRLMEVGEKTQNSAIQQAVCSFRKLTPQQRQMLVESIHVLDGAPCVLDIPKKIKAKITAVRREHLDAVYERLEGWWFNKVIHHMSAEPAGVISKIELRNRIADIAEGFRPDALPTDFLTAEPSSPPDPENDPRLFVIQLKMVAIDSRRIEKAILDFYRAFEQRSSWVREQLLVDEDLGRYEARLIDEWDRKLLVLMDDCSAVSGEDEDALRQLGRSVYKWVEMEADIRIRPNVTERYVMRGSYHMLADGSPPSVWWHPRFLEAHSGQSQS